MLSSRRGRLLLAVLAVWSAGLWPPGPGLVGAARDSRFALETDDSGGYVNFLVVIGEKVREDLALLSRLVYVMTEASKFLFQATRNQVYFKEVHVLIPESWADSEGYEEAEWQRFGDRDLLVDIPSDSQGNVPYVRKGSPCGQPGEFIHLTPDYILSERVAALFGPYGKLFAHEWGHYRWGVFDEYPYPTDKQHFYADKAGNIEAVRCVLNIPGTLVNPRTGGPCSINSSGFPEDDCRFLDDRENRGYTGSLMYKQFLPRISNYCEKESNGVSKENTHNRDAPNRQNIRCRGKSIWEVMLEHGDFAPLKGENDVRGGRSEAELTPAFKFVKKRPLRLVLVLDVSGSMEGHRLTQLRQAAEQLISQILEDGQQLGIVTFAKTASIRSHLLEIGPTSRQTLLNHIPTRADGATSIGAGILAGIEVLEGRDGDQVAVGGKLLVITDGLENRDPLIDDVIPQLNGSGIVVDTFAIGMTASPDLEKLSILTGGSTYYHDDESNTLADAFGKSSTVDKDTKSTPVTLVSDFVIIPDGQRYSGVVFVDSSIGHKTQFLFGHSEGGQIDVRVTQPDGAVISAASPGYVAIDDFSNIRISIAADAQVGLWQFELVNTGDSPVSASILVQSQALQGKDPIAIESKWGLPSVTPPQKQALYVTVGKGYVPVVGGEVTASVELPCGDGNDTVTLYPRDDGIGADITKDDGIYSAFFTEFCKDGRYGVSVKVKNKGKDTAVASGKIVGVGAALDPSGETEYQPATELLSTGDFLRVTIGESFRCEGSHLCNGSVDMYPPSRIVDLLASPVDIETMEIRLTFTAPGDDLTTGQASRYHIVMSRNTDDIFDNFGEVPEIPLDSFVQGNVSRPRSSGETEVFVVRVPEIGRFSYAFAVAAEDDEGNRGEPSNLATSSARDFAGPPLGLIVGVAVAALVLLILITVLACCWLRRRRGRKGGKAGEAAGGESGAPDRRRADPTAPVCLTVSGSVAGHGDSSQVTNEYQNPPTKMPTSKPAVAGRPQTPIKPVVASGGGPPKTALKPTPGKGRSGGAPAHPARRHGGAEPSTGPPAGEVNAGFEAAGTVPPESAPLYSDFISRRDRDPNWDPTVANNREGGGANIKAGHVTEARSKFDQMGLLK